MKAAIFHQFQSTIQVQNVADPTPNTTSAIIQVKATGICRSDWHGWMGHDGDVQLPHVPGHELAGVIVEVGKEVQQWKKGDRVTVPFACGCGTCVQCSTGNEHICDNYFQPGFTAWGSFAEYVEIAYADVNLVRLPEAMGFREAAVLGCRFITAYRGIVAQGQLQAKQWIAIHGCGGVGLSAIMIAKALDANIIAVDIDDTKLELATQLGATTILNANQVDDVPAAIQEITKGGAAVSVDALGHSQTCLNSIASLRKRGKHIQIGLMTGPHTAPAIPMPPIIAKELEIIGSHGMQAHQYGEMFDLIQQQQIPLNKMIGSRLSLEEGAKTLMEMGRFPNLGVMVIDRF